MSSGACRVCGSLGNVEESYSKYGWPENDYRLPPAKSSLVEIVSNVSSRGNALYQCPECRAYFHYNLDYEFLVNGTEDTETLTRISDAKAEELKTLIEKSRR